MPQLGSCASSGCAWRLWVARHSQGEAQPLGAHPLPRVLELAASKAPNFQAHDRLYLRLLDDRGGPGAQHTGDARQLTLTLTLILTLTLTLTR